MNPMPARGKRGRRERVKGRPWGWALAALILGWAMPAGGQYLRLDLLYEATSKGERLQVLGFARVEETFALDGLVREEGAYAYEVSLKSGDKAYLLETVHFDIPNERVGETFDWRRGTARAEIDRLGKVVFPFRMPIYEDAFFVRFTRRPAGNRTAPERIGEWEYPPPGAKNEERR